MGGVSQALDVKEHLGRMGLPSQQMLISATLDFLLRK